MRFPMTDKKNDITKQNNTEPNELPEKSFPVVGIGASAGGLAAFEAFFSGMPADIDPGMAFVLVQHLAPDHKSILTDLIQRYTRMKVFEVKDGMKVNPNCAYIIPPNCDMAFFNGSLQLLTPAAPRGQRMPIDFFFRSLAKDQREKAICIIFSGTGSDGTLGLREIKGEGGMVMAQNPASTEYDGMPINAIATGLVDYILPPAEMPAQLMSYVTHAFGKIILPVNVKKSNAENALKKIFVLMRTQTSHDFSQYKPSTMNRRIERRMAIHQIKTIDKYVEFLQINKAEIALLFQDFLIGVTSFFRDPEAFKVVEEQIIPKLFIDKSSNKPVRVWCVGCSTGEEAYSIAILIQEYLDTHRNDYLKVHIFATDIDSHAIAIARAGIYPISIANDISAERLERFFTTTSDGNAYRIQKSIRDMLIFSEQNLIKDPPFAKLDFISCRNLMIYIKGSLQKKIIPLFNYALKAKGFLFLGTSETVGDFLDLFITIDRKAKVYQNKDNFQGMQSVTQCGFLPPMIMNERYSRSNEKTKSPVKLNPRDLTEKALLQHSIKYI
ncbi:MAG: hypothetical protein HQK67_08105 [Desulfamplus sp.]|nr:hypothetical protein [Desulfamplus sp.]